jgi:hypothetical protein
VTVLNGRRVLFDIELLPLVISGGARAPTPYLFADPSWESLSDISPAIEPGSGCQSSHHRAATRGSGAERVGLSSAPSIADVIPNITTHGNRYHRAHRLRPVPACGLREMQRLDRLRQLARPRIGHHASCGGASHGVSMLEIAGTSRARASPPGLGPGTGAHLRSRADLPPESARRSPCCSGPERFRHSARRQPRSGT